MKKEVIVVNEEDFLKKKNSFISEGKDFFHVVSDFDRTITYGLNKEGKRTETVISKLRSDVKYLGEDYFKRAHELFEIYHPIEIDFSIPLENKKEKMLEWWTKHFELLIESGLDKELIKKVVSEKPLHFRKGSSEFFNFLEKKEIPLVFLSAAPGDMLLEYLNSQGTLKKNIYVLSNLYEFDFSGKAIRIKKPIIHTFNKGEISLKEHPFFEKLSEKKNVLLLGDSSGDAEMAEGLFYSEIIKIGFFNEGTEEDLEEFKKKFDVVLTGDSDFDFINKLLKDLFSKSSEGEKNE
jgi:cytosolic 5'-nucleotidase 3